MTVFAPILARAVAEARAEGRDLESIATLHVVGAGSLRGIHRLASLETLILERPASLRHLRGHPSIERVEIDGRGWHKPHVDIAPLAEMPALEHVLLHDLRIGRVDALCARPLRTLTIRFCELPRQRLRPPPTLTALDLDATTGLRLAGVCPNLRTVDLWGTDMDPLGWVARQGAIEELWLNGCRVPTLAPLLAMSQPPRWISLSADERELARHRELVATLETRGARFVFGDPFSTGIWVSSWGRVSPQLEDPLYLSPSWPRAAPE